MRLATLRTGPDGRTTAAARIEGDQAVILDQFADVASVLEAGALEAAASLDGTRVRLDQARFAPVVPAPGKILCVGMNYRAHTREMGRSSPTHPALFSKWKETLIGHGESIQLPPESSRVDWEGELVVVIGKRLRRADLIEAANGIGGYTLMCDTSMRDWQYRTPQWLQGKTWERSTPLGPWLATPDELPANAEITTKVDGHEAQRAQISDLVASPAALVSYISTFISLSPGDLIATGTPAGVGHARQPPVYLQDGQEVEIAVTGLGTLRAKVENEVVSTP
ncbi:MAG: fumarylacetoacetate hydrolase family protein [Bifidobacteriaceae bacterium]|jgi:acylpyruvate hydrolase|nr:fumarylacetoacetate hydrolase family protein [Bifidobacteriaceae bacterium]